MPERPGMRFIVARAFLDYQAGAVIEIDPDTMEGRTARRIGSAEGRSILAENLQHLCPMEGSERPKRAGLALV